MFLEEVVIKKPVGICPRIKEILSKKASSFKSSEKLLSSEKISTNLLEWLDIAIIWLFSLTKSFIFEIEFFESLYLIGRILNGGFKPVFCISSWDPM